VSALLCRTGAGAPRELPPGVAAYLWTTERRDGAGRPLPRGGLRRAWRGAEAAVRAARPDALVLHAPPGLVDALPEVARAARAALPCVRLWVGVGGDGWADDWRAGRVPGERVVSELVRAARVAREVDAEAVIWDFEAAWKAAPADKHPRAELEALASAAVRACAAEAPDAVHGLTSYDHPTLHTALPWRGFFEPGALSLYVPQVYPAVPGGAPRGAVPARLRSSARSQAEAERRGMLPPDVRDATGADVADDVDRIAAVQLHGLDVRDQVAVLADEAHVAAWALPLIDDGGRADPSGVRALEAALRLRREVGGGPGAVARWQAARGLVADGIVGPRTLAALER